MSVQVVANLVDESILTNLPFLPENLGSAWRNAQNIFVPSGSYGQIWSLMTAESSTPPVFIYDITSSNGDLRFKGSIGDDSNDGGKYKGYGIYAANLDKILLTTTSTIYAFSSSVISAQSDGFLAPLGGAMELSLISYSCSFRVNNNGEGVTNIGFAAVPNMFTYTPSASIGYYSVFSYATSSNGDAISVSRINTPLSASIATLSSSGQNISGAANLYPLGFFMSTFNSYSPTNEIYVDLTTPLTSSFGIPLDKILKGIYAGNTLTNFGQSVTYTGTYNSDLNRIYVTVGFASGEIGIVELNNNTTPPTVISVVTSSGILSIYRSDITYNNINKDFIILTGTSTLSSQYKIIDASSTLNTSKFTSPKSTVTLTGSPPIASAGQMLAISNSYYQSLPIRGNNSPLTTPFSSSLYFLNRIQSNSLGYNVTSQSFAKSYESPEQWSYGTFGLAHATSSNINKIITADRSNVGPIDNPDTYDENLTTTFARAGYIYSLDLTTLTTSSFFTPYTTQLNGTNASTSVTVSGSTEIGYKLNTRNLVLAYDAGSEDSFPPPPNTNIYDLSGNLNNTVLPNNVTYSSISSSFYFTSSLVHTGIPFASSELSNASFATFEMIAKLNNPAFSGGTFNTLYGFYAYVLIQAGNTINFGNFSGRYIYPSSPSVYPGSNWFHIVAEMHISASDPVANNKMWLNGIPQALTSNFDPGDLPSCTFNGGIGKIADTTLNSTPIQQGYIPIFKIYKRVLSQQEITDNYNFYRTRYPIP